MSEMKFEIKDAERKKVPARILLTGPPGCGKTLTAIRIAKGIEAITGFKILVIDSEAESSQHYACNANEAEETGKKYKFKYLNLYNPTVNNYIGAIAFAKKNGYKTIIIDSITHEWFDLIEQVHELSKDSSYNNNSFRAWGEGTPLHRKFINAILTYPGHVICTCRSKIKYEMIQMPNGKAKPKIFGMAPEQRSGTGFEFSIQFDGEGGTNNPFYCSKDRTGGLFQDKTIEKPDENVGAEIVNWLMSGSGDEMYIPEDPTLIEVRLAIKQGLELLKPTYAKQVSDKLECKYEKCEDAEALNKVTKWLRLQYKIAKNRR